MINLKTDLRPLDVLEFPSYDNFYWWEPWTWGNAATASIQQDARNYLSGNSEWHSIHTEIYFDPQHIVRCMPGKVCWDTVDAIAQRKDKVQVYRHSYPFSAVDGQFMINAFQGPIDYTACGIPHKNLTVIGSEYDLLADASLAWESIFGSPDSGTESWDTGSRIFCSCSAVLALRYYRFAHNNPYPDLFSKIQPDAFKGAFWEKSILASYQKGNILQTVNAFPAALANTDTHFNHELTFVGKNFQQN